ncbi:MAG: hypothetical protein IH946_08590 [Bacteroidetes bacterium]|nr:hypothetical protein [Bacteroidota bacterium]
MKRTLRKYSYSDEDMLLAANKLCENFSEHKLGIFSVKPEWLDPFIDDFQKRVHLAMKEFMSQNLPQAIWISIQIEKHYLEEILINCELFKNGLEECYEEDKQQLDWLMKTFGFTEYWPACSTKKDFISLTKLLKKLRDSLTTGMKAELLGKKFNATLINKIRSYTAELEDAGISSDKNATDNNKRITNEAIEEFNSIFMHAMSICWTVEIIFKNKPSVETKFMFSNLVEALHKPDDLFGTGSLDKLAS